MAQALALQAQYLNPPQTSTSWADPTMHPMNVFFGGPNLPLETYPFDGQNETTWLLPESLRKNSLLISNTLELARLLNADYTITVLLPLVKSDNVNITWTKWEFVPTLAETLPHLGVVRFVKSNRISGKAALNRKGIGMMLEHGFMTTQDGVNCYVGGLRQMNQAMNEAMQLDALHCLINVGNYEINLARTLNIFDEDDLAEKMEYSIEREVAAWGFLQYNRNAWSLLDDMIQDTVLRYNQNTPLTHYIVDQRINSFRKTRDFSQITYNIFGPGSQFGLQDGLQNFDIDDKGKIIYATRTCFADGVAVNPLQRVAQVGEYVRCFNHASDNMKNYSSAVRTQKIYNEATDSMERIGLDKKIHHSMRFDENGQLRHIRDARKRGNVKEESAVDFLHHRVKGKLETIKFMGHMSNADFNVRDYERFVETFEKLLEKKAVSSIPDLQNALFELAEEARYMDTLAYDDAFNDYLLEISQANAGTMENYGSNRADANTSAIKANLYGGEDIPTTGTARGLVTTNKWQLPPGYGGNYAGMKTIAETYKRGNYTAETGFNAERAKKISEYIILFERFADLLKEALPENLLTSSRLANPGILQARHYHVLYENLIAPDFSQRHLFLHVTSGATPNPATNIPESDYIAAENEFPALASARARLEERVLGNFSTADVNFIGTEIRRGPNNDPLMFATLQRPSAAFRDPATGRTIFAASRFSGAAVVNAGAVVDFDAESPPASARLSDSANLPNFTNIVYDALARLVYDFKPSGALGALEDRVRFDAVHVFIVSLLSLANLPSTGNDRVVAGSSNIAKIIETIQQTLGIRYDLQAPLTGGPFTADVFDRLLTAVGQLHARDPQAFTANVKPQGLIGLKEEIVRSMNEIIRRNPNPTGRAYAGARPAGGAANPPGFASRQDPDLTSYKMSSLTVSRSTLASYLQYARNSAGRVNAIPASNKSPLYPMSIEELNIASASNIIPEAYPHIGFEFAPENIQKNATQDIENLALIKIADMRVNNGYDSDRESSARAREIQSQSGIGKQMTNNSMFADILSGDADYSSSYKRRRTSEINSKSMNTSTVEEVPSLPSVASKSLVIDELTDSLKSMFKTLMVQFDSNPLGRIIAIALLLTPFTKQFLNNTDKYNLDHPVDYLIVRPHMTYQTLSLINMAPGLQTGQTSYGNIITEIGDDASNQTHFVSVSSYFGSHVHTPKNVFVLHDVMTCGYVRGSATDPIDVAFYDPYSGIFGQNNNASLIYMMVSKHARFPHKYFTLSGRQILIDRLGNTDVISNASTHGYPVADYYNAIWNFNGTTWNNPDYVDFLGQKYNNSVVTPNNLVFKAYAKYYDPSTKKWSEESSPQGHFKVAGPNTHLARIGKASFANEPVVRPGSIDVY